MQTLSYNMDKFLSLLISHVKKNTSHYIAYTSPYFTINMTNDIGYTLLSCATKTQEKQKSVTF